MWVDCYCSADFCHRNCGNRSKKEKPFVCAKMMHCSRPFRCQVSELYGHSERMQEVAELVKWLISIGAKVETIGAYVLHAVIRLCIRASE